MEHQFICRFCEFLMLDSGDLRFTDLNDMAAHSLIHAQKNDCTEEHMMNRCFGIERKPSEADVPIKKVQESLHSAISVVENAKLTSEEPPSEQTAPQTAPPKRRGRKRKSELPKETLNSDEAKLEDIFVQPSASLPPNWEIANHDDQQKDSCSSEETQTNTEFEQQPAPSEAMDPSLMSEEDYSIAPKGSDNENLNNASYWEYMNELETRLNGTSKFCKKISCRYENCGKEVSGKRDLLDVHVLHHAKLDIYHCVFCALCFNNRSSAYAHIGKEHVKTRFVFNDNMVDLHQEYESSLLACLRKCFPLDGCNTESSEESVIQAPAQKRHSSVEDLPDEFKAEYKRWHGLFYEGRRKELACRYKECEWTRRGSFSRFAVEEHVAAHAGVNLSGCLKCGAKLRNSNGILHFQNIHPGTPPANFLQDLRPHFRKELLTTASQCFY